MASSRTRFVHPLIRLKCAGRIRQKAQTHAHVSAFVSLRFQSFLPQRSAPPSFPNWVARRVRGVEATRRRSTFKVVLFRKLAMRRSTVSERLLYVITATISLISL